MASLRVALVASSLSAQVTLTQAYPCQAAFKPVSDSATKKCASSTCSDAECCVEDDTKCGNSKTVQYCDNGKAMEFGSPGTNTEECCTVETVKCDTMTCSAPFKDKANKDTIDCGGTTCSEFQCCDVDSDYCVAHSCGSGKYLPRSKHTVKGNTDADCCEDLGKCGDVTCGQTWSWPDGDMWMTAAPFKDDSSRKDMEYNPDYEVECPSGQLKKDIMVGSDEATCCRDPPICETYTPATGGGAASGAKFGSEFNWLVAGAAVVMASLA